jgi:hypothetical protein
MSPKRPLIEEWRNRNFHGHPIEDVKREAERFGFTAFRQKNGHYKFKHPLLEKHPRFPLGFFVVSAHNKNDPGKAHPAGVRDLVKAIDIIENQ